MNNTHAYLRDLFTRAIENLEQGRGMIDRLPQEDTSDHVLHAMDGSVHCYQCKQTWPNEQEAQAGGEDEGYPGIAHDLERYRTALEQIAGTGACRGLSDLDTSHAACIGIARAALQSQGKNGEANNAAQ